MDIIAAHQQGLIEQLDAEVDALAGRPRDHVQRAIVLHHLYEHSKGSHIWALGEARRSLRIASSLAALERWIVRWQWTLRDPARARDALDGLAEALGEAARARTSAAYLAYRLSATKALRGEAEVRLPSPLLRALDECHSARRENAAIASEACILMAERTEEFAAAAVDGQPVEAAWAAVSATAIGGKAQSLLGEEALERFTARDERKGCARVERQLRNDPALPASFRANPAQQFYALQNALSERRRQKWRELCDREPDAVALAA